MSARAELDLMPRFLKALGESQFQEAERLLKSSERGASTEELLVVGRARAAIAKMRERARLSAPQDHVRQAEEAKQHWHETQSVKDFNAAIESLRLALVLDERYGPAYEAMVALYEEKQEPTQVARWSFLTILHADVKHFEDALGSARLDSLLDHCPGLSKGELGDEKLGKSVKLKAANYLRICGLERFSSQDSEGAILYLDQAIRFIEADAVAEHAATLLGLTSGLRGRYKMSDAGNYLNFFFEDGSAVLRQRLKTLLKGSVSDFERAMILAPTSPEVTEWSAALKLSREYLAAVEAR
ncbi:hypothetical protein [Prosthecobacter sp.]|uniref:hypothetical protein n=1 Tax=Prosthecobacter sp. TaxID=1965333 RepID=UPI003904D952